MYKQSKEGEHKPNKIERVHRKPKEKKSQNL